MNMSQNARFLFVRMPSGPLLVLRMLVYVQYISKRLALSFCLDGIALHVPGCRRLRAFYLKRSEHLLPRPFQRTLPRSKALALYNCRLTFSLLSQTCSSFVASEGNVLIFYIFHISFWILKIHTKAGLDQAIGFVSHYFNLFKHKSRQLKVGALSLSAFLFQFLFLASVLMFDSRQLQLSRTMVSILTPLLKQQQQQGLPGGGIDYSEWHKMLTNNFTLYSKKIKKSRSIQVY